MKLASALAVLAASAVTAAAEPIPGMMGIDHIGLTVPDMTQATGFFADVMGCQKATSFGPFRDDSGTFMADTLGVDPRAVIEEITLMRCGNGSNLELFKYTAPDQKTVSARNSDIGGHHVAFYVKDIDAAAAYLKTKGVKTFAGPLPIKEGPVAGQSILYFLTPWGLQLELISYPDGEAYEKDGGPVLWSPRTEGG